MHDKLEEYHQCRGANTNGVKTRADGKADCGGGPNTRSGGKTLYGNIPDKNNACAEEAYTCGDTGGNT